MAYDDFIGEIARRAGTTAEVLAQRPKTFAMNTNFRGRKMLQTLAANDVDIAGKNVLDIGCAYGGMAIEAAKAGATAIGLDVNEDLLSLARLNAKDDVDIKFYECDATSQQMSRLVEPNWADLVILNDVLEHIYDTVKLLDNLRRHAAPGCVFYFEVPNGLSARFVNSEGHRKIFALSVLDPDCWHYFVNGRPRIFYRRWEYFESLFAHFGLVRKSELHKYHETSEVTSLIEAGLAEIEKTFEATTWPSDEHRSLAREAIDKYFAEVNDDLERLSPRALDHKYLVDFWKGLYSLQ